MKKSFLLTALLATFILTWCGSNEAKLQAAQDYCDSTEGSLTTSWNLYVCSYADGSECAAEDFRTASCPDINLDEIIEPEIDERIHDAEGRLALCEEQSLFYLNINDATFTWNEENEAGASFMIYGHVDYVKNSEADGTYWRASDDINCYIDMVDGSTTVEFNNHEFLGELSEEELNEMINTTANESNENVEEVIEEMGEVAEEAIETIE